MNFILRMFTFLLAIFLVVPSATTLLTAATREISAEEAWEALPKYEYGQDMAALLTVDREVISAMAATSSQTACAARLAAILESTEVTLPAQQYVCLQLRLIGTAAEVPILKRLLANPKTSQMARYALESIPGEESLDSMRDAIEVMQGDLLIGLINSVAVRKDIQAVVKLQELADSKDAKVASAAHRALGNIASSEAIAFIRKRAKHVGTPMPLEIAVPLLRCGDALAATGDFEQSQAIYDELSVAGQPVGIRRAALNRILQHDKEQTVATILSWIGDTDPDRRLVAGGRLATLSNPQLDQLASRLTELPDASQMLMIEVLASRKGKGALPQALFAARSDKLALKLVGIRILGQLGDASTLEFLVDFLAEGGKVAEAAQQALCRLPRDATGQAVLAALKERPEIRGPVLEVLKKMKYYEAIDPLITIASQDDPAVYELALDALRGIADPDDADLSRLIKLLLTVQGKHREEVEKTILVVCEKSPDAAVNRAKPVLAVLGKFTTLELPEYLPLLGRLGGHKALEMTDLALSSDNLAVKNAAIQSLCNWPSAEVSDRLWAIANSDNGEYRRRALRAYIRVVTLKSDRPAPQTMVMLQKAMQLAENSEDRQLILSRTPAALRTLDAVAWIAEYLDDPELGQTACKAIVELAHHRFLRHPNMDRFGPLLEKVSRICKDPRVVERAKKYRLGL